MTTQNEERDPFPEPQTIPSGWDTSGFFSAPALATATKSDSASDTENC